MNTTQLYGAIIVSVLVCITFAVALFEAYMRGDQPTVSILIGAITSSFVTVVGFWIGSSIGSQKKDAMLLSATPHVVTDGDNKVIPPPKALES